MQVAALKDMIGGWFVGSFEPTAFKTDVCEVAVKHYSAGAYDSRHHHKLATEITVIVSGEVEMNGVRYRAGEILVIHPGEATDFRCIQDATTAVVKIPGARDDKYLGDAV